MIKKRIAAVALSLCMAAPMTAALTTNGILLDTIDGDVNADGKFAVSDLVMMRGWLIGSCELNAAQTADFNHDDTVDTFDYLFMLKAIKNLYFPDYVPPYVYTAENLCEGIEPSEVMGAEPDEQFILGQTEFALSLLQRSGAMELENTLISPYSVMQALAMTANGADGDTKSAMEDVLGGITIEELNEYLYTQRTSQPDYEECWLTTANSIWTIDDDERIQLSQEFLKSNVDYYGAETYKAPFDNSTVKDINNWVNDNTNGMIPEILQACSPSDVMYLINAVALDAKWENQYEECMVHEFDFTAADGAVQTADMLCSEENFYIRDENAIGIYKYYEGRRYAFAALMPDEGISIGDYIAQLTPERLNNAFSEPIPNFVYSKIPKFSYSYSDNLRDDLSDMGMGVAFSPFANFSRIAKTASGSLFIGRVIHSTFIDLNEAGTKAAAVTAVSMNDSCIIPCDPLYITLDRPFVYAIVDTETALPIFIGALTSIPEAE